MRGWSLDADWNGSRVEVAGSSVAVSARRRDGVALQQRACWSNVWCVSPAEFDVFVEYGPRRDPNRIIGAACAQHLAVVGSRLARDQFV